jgi:TolB-like protein
MKQRIPLSILAATLAVGLVPPRRRRRRRPAQRISTTISTESGAVPKFALPAFIPLSNDADTVAAARLVTNVLWDDLNFEREFSFIPRDVYATIPAAKSLEDVPLDRWHELNADGVIDGTVQKSGTGFLIRVRIFDVKSRRPAFGSEYTGSANARVYAHAISDEIFLKQRGFRGVARTKLTFRAIGTASGSPERSKIET